MVFLGIYRATFEYTSQSEAELSIQEGDLLFVIEKSAEDDWWKAKKKALREDEVEPEGLIPNNYVEEASPIANAKALYDYTRQTDEEISFSEEDFLDVYDVSDPNWTLVGARREYGFAPANYIEVSAEPQPSATAEPSRDPDVERENPRRLTPPPSNTPSTSSAAALAVMISKNVRPLASEISQRNGSSTSVASVPKKVQHTPEESEEEISAPSLPQRPDFKQMTSPTTATPDRFISPLETTPSPSLAQFDVPSPEVDFTVRSPNGFHLYNIHEMVSSMGKNKKMPMTLGVNIPKGLILISPEKSMNGLPQEWTADKLSNYSIEGKHIFMELVKPSRSIDFHAGAKDTAHEIVSALGELAGAARASGLREVLAAGSGSSNVRKKGKVMYDFVAQGDDEINVAIGDEVLILDDSKSSEWWMVRRLKSGNEGVVPSNYVEIMEFCLTERSLAQSHVSKNREEHIGKRQASKARRVRDESISKGSERRRHEHKDLPSSNGKASNSKPDPVHVRTWTDRSGSFKVEAEFMCLKDGKIHLHKLNGVKIAVPVPKMSIEDLEYVEKVTGVSLDEDKPLSDIRRTKGIRSEVPREDDRSKAGISPEQVKKPEYDWFDFFLRCGVKFHTCERYAASFAKDDVGEESMPDISETLLRTLGLKEGDILRVMKFLDNKYERTGKDTKNVKIGDTAVNDDRQGDKVNGSVGAARNKHGKGRPIPVIQTNNVVDAKIFAQKTANNMNKKDSANLISTSLALTPASENDSKSGFDDNAWEVKPLKQPVDKVSTLPHPVNESEPATAASKPDVTGALADLSILSEPLKPVPSSQQPQKSQESASMQPQVPLKQPDVANLFDQFSKALPAQQIQAQHTNTFMEHQFNNPSARQRPQAQQPNPPQGSLLVPLSLPPRASSAPQNLSQQNTFSPLAPLQAQPTTAPRMMTQISLPGKSLNDLGKRHFQPGIGQQPIQTYPNGFIPNNLCLQQFHGPLTQVIDIPPNLQQPQVFGQFHQQQQQPPHLAPVLSQPSHSFVPQPQLDQQPTGINAFLPPALQPQRTNAPLATPGQQFIPPLPPISTTSQVMALQPQKTGPPPPVRFGVQPPARNLTPQPTTRRANLSQATPQNPFGF